MKYKNIEVIRGNYSDKLKGLEKLEAVIRSVPDGYQTDLIILSDEHFEEIQHLLNHESKILPANTET